MTKGDLGGVPGELDRLKAPLDRPPKLRIPSPTPAARSPPGSIPPGQRGVQLSLEDPHPRDWLVEVACRNPSDLLRLIPSILFPPFSVSRGRYLRDHAYLSVGCPERGTSSNSSRLAPHDPSVRPASTPVAVGGAWRDNSDTPDASPFPHLPDSLLQRSTTRLRDAHG